MVEVLVQATEHRQPRQVREVVVTQRVGTADAGALGRPVDVHETRLPGEPLVELQELDLRVALATEDDERNDWSAPGPIAFIVIR